MSQPLVVEITRRASAQIERAAVWWAENRPDARDAILLDFEEANGFLARQPGLGAKSATPRTPTCVAYIFDAFVIMSITA